MVLDPANDRLGQETQVNLIVTSKKSHAIEIIAPANPRGQKIRADLVIGRRINSPKQICGFEREIEPRRCFRNSGTYAAIVSSERGLRHRQGQSDYHPHPPSHEPITIKRTTLFAMGALSSASVMPASIFVISSEAETSLIILA